MNINWQQHGKFLMRMVGQHKRDTKLFMSSDCSYVKIKICARGKTTSNGQRWLCTRDSGSALKGHSDKAANKYRPPKWVAKNKESFWIRISSVIITQAAIRIRYNLTKGLYLINVHTINVVNERKMVVLFIGSVVTLLYCDYLTNKNALIMWLLCREFPEWTHFLKWAILPLEIVIHFIFKK